MYPVPEKLAVRAGKDADEATIGKKLREIMAEDAYSNFSDEEPKSPGKKV